MPPFINGCRQSLGRALQRVSIRQHVTDLLMFLPRYSRSLDHIRLCLSNYASRSYFRRNRWRLAEFSSVGGKYLEQSPSVKFLDDFKRSLDLLPATCAFEDLAKNGSMFVGQQVTLHGYLGTRRDASKSLTFAELHDIHMKSTLQLVSVATKGDDDSDRPYRLLRNLREHTPITVSGMVKTRKAPRPSSANSHRHHPIKDVELRVENIVPLNTLPEDIIMSPETIFPPEERHLQIRNNGEIRTALAFRSDVARLAREELCRNHGFIDIETPLLFKSTPEGAREFLVPTRTPGLAYALPQSPQQYKQILMASGISRYMQVARCFRDEDLRTDRQPEFTQIDLEMAFASGEEVMLIVERLIKILWSEMLGDSNLPERFGRMSYGKAMSDYGSDKPDLRIGSKIQRIDHILPVDLVKKLGPLDFPAVDVMKLSVSQSPEETFRFVDAFMSSPEAQPFIKNPHGQPGIFFYDSRKPLSGLQSLGFEAAEQLEEIYSLQDGDLLVLQARKDMPFFGGSTPLGNLRVALHKAAVKQGLKAAPVGFKFTWITDFPLFSPIKEDEPGQSGTAGIASTHHPFTAPKTSEDVDLLVLDPTLCKADHYDLVVNGIELGGGSRRIHSAEVQEFVMRNVLKMNEARMEDFAHLLKVLRAGCPPHAGFALGFDRLVAVMLNKESVRDVIAFPKSGRGEDVLVGSPTSISEEHLKTYHLQLRQ